MIAKYENGTQGLGLGSGAFGSTTTGASGESGKPFNFNFSKMVTPLFFGAEYLNTVHNTNKQLEGTLQTLYSLRPPERAPELIHHVPNYNAVDQQYIDAEAKINSMPIFGSSVDRQIAQQQARGEQISELEKQRIQNYSQMMMTNLKEKETTDFKNAAQRYQDTKSITQHDNTIATTVQDEKDKARAINTEALSTLMGETNKLWQLQQAREKEKNLAMMRLEHDKGLQSAIDEEKSIYDDNLAQEFRNQFDEDISENGIQDDEEFEAKYGFSLKDWEDEAKKYDSDIYKAAYDAHVKSKEADWKKKVDEITNAYETKWINRWGNLYYDNAVYKKGGRIKTSDSSTKKSLSMEERIIIDNNKNLHNFVKQMNDRQTKLLLKLLSL